MLQKISKRDRLTLAVVLAAYLCIAIITGLHHEPWADEAQAWLLARDNDIFGILWAERYEGTLPTWHFIIKIFQTFGLRYDYFFVIPVLFSALGIVLLFLTDAPYICKILLPFSFYVLYQESVVARQYCLIFPAMMLIVLTYKKRNDKPVRFFLSLFAILSTSSYGVIIACSFMLWEFICLVRDHFFPKKGGNESISSRYRISFWIAAIVLVVIIFLSIPPSDASFGAVFNHNNIISATATFLFYVDKVWVGALFLISLTAALILYFRHNIVQFLVYTVPLILYLFLFYHQRWHLPYLFFLVVSLMIIFRDKADLLNKDKPAPVRLVLSGYFIVLLAIQSACGFYSSYLDYYKPYYPAKAMAEYIRPYVDSGAVIDGFGFLPVSLKPYFDKEIYSNNPSDKGYYIWSVNYNYYELSNPPADIIVSSYEGFDDPYDLYDMISFDGYAIYKFSAIEENSLSIYVRKDLKSITD